MRSFEADFLTTTFVRQDPETSKPFAGGERANNKLEADRIVEDSNLFWRIAYGFADWVMAEYEDPAELDCIVGIPDGGTSLAAATSDVLAPAYRIPVVYFKKLGVVEGIKRFAPVSSVGADRIRRARNIAVVDDVSTQHSSLKGLLLTEELAGTSIKFCSAFHRGEPDLLLPENSPVPCDTLASQYIPAMLSDNSEMWRYA